MTDNTQPLEPLFHRRLDAKLRELAILRNAGVTRDEVLAVGPTGARRPIGAPQL